MRISRDENVSLSKYKFPFLRNFYMWVPCFGNSVTCRRFA